MPAASVKFPSVLSETDLALARPRLVQFCAHVAGDATVAEDLAQETLLEAWRVQDRLVDPSGLIPWLLAIARNVCLRWRRRAGRSVAALPLEEGALLQAPDHDPADAMLAEAERHERLTRLTRALDTLPSLTRLALLAHLVDGTPHAAVAARLGMSESAVAVRVHRAKAALRHRLDDPSGLGQRLRNPSPNASAPPLWQETRIWCPQCGQHRLLGRLDVARGDFAVRCPSCSPEPGLEISNTSDHPGLFAGIHGFKAAYTRVLRWAHGYYRTLLADYETRVAPCWQCGRGVPLQLRLPYDDPWLHPSEHGQRGVYVRCICKPTDWRHCSTRPRSLTLHLPAVQRFWRQYPRMRALPEREVDLGGRTGLVTGFESLGSPARIEVVALADSFAVLGIYGCGYDLD